MESTIAVDLAEDVLFEHFGGPAARVGRVLLERGALPLLEILRFSNDNMRPGDEELQFPRCRNALLILVRHRVVTVKPHPADVPPKEASQNGEIQAGGNRAIVRGQYSIDIQDIIDRIRFASYLEHVEFAYGKAAKQLAFLVFKHGCASKSFIIENSMEDGSSSAGDDVELDNKFMQMARDGLFHAVPPLNAPAGGDGIADQRVAREIPNAAAEAAQGSEESLPKKLRLPTLAEQEQHRQHTPIIEGSLGDVVYAYDRHQFNLRLKKNMILRYVEQEFSNNHAQVVFAVMSGVKLTSDRGDDVICQDLNFDAILGKLCEIGACKAGHLSVPQQQNWRRMLDDLSTNDTKILRKRSVKSVKVAPGQGLNNRDAADNQTINNLRKVSGAPGQSGVSDETLEWAIEWNEVSRLLMKSLVSQIIRDHCEIFGLRVYNLLTEGLVPQRLDEKTIQQTCMVPSSQAREVLNKMVRMGFVSWQEVPRAANAPLVASTWLYFIDQKRLNTAVLQLVMQTTLNLRVRMRAEEQATLPLESREQAGSLTAPERARLRAMIRHQDALERVTHALGNVLSAFDKPYLSG